MTTFIILSIFIFFIVSIKYPEFIFWIGIFGILDIGGYFEHFSNQALGLDISQYIFLTCIFFPLVSNKIKLNHVKYNKTLFGLIKFLAFFAFYHILVYGFFIANNNINEFLYFIAKFSPEILGSFAVIPAFLIIKRKPHRFYYIFLALASLYLGTYFITVFSDYNIMPLIDGSERGNAIRNILPNFVYLQSLISIAFILIISKLNIKYKNTYIFLAILTIVAVLMSMSRLRIFIMIAEILIIAVIYANIRKMKITVYTRVIVIGLIIFLIVINTVPKYYKAVSEMFTNIYTEFFTDKIETGTFQTRTEYEIPLQLSLLKESPVFGTGYDARWYSGGRGAYNASDTPFLAAIAMFGVTGIIIYLIYYFKIFVIIRKNFFFLKKHYFSLLSKNSKIIILLYVFCLGVLFMTLVNFFDYFKELVRGERAVYIALLLGMLLALKHNMNIKLISNKE